MDSQVLTSTALSRADVVRKAGGFDESLPYSEDWDFWLRISRDSQFIKLSDATTLYRQHPSQGSKVIRNIDYRTRLLRSAVRKWGLCSPDGKCISKRQFQRQLAQYSASFGLNHLSGSAGADRLLAAKSFVNAFLDDFTYWKSLAYLVATPLGWKPKWQ